MIVIDGVKVSPGSKRSWDFPVGETVTGRVTLPITVVNGTKEGPVLAVLAGCHPGEVNGIMTSIRLANEVEPKILSGKLLLVHVLNVMGVQFKKGHISPLDGVNLGGAYPTETRKEADDSGQVSHQGKSLTYSTAERVFNEIILKADYVVDLHGGEYFESLPSNIEIKPTGEEEIDKKTRFLARAFGFDLIWEVPKGSIPEMPNYPGRGSATTEAPQNGIPAAVCEVGGEGKLESTLVNFTLEGLRNVMRTLEMLPGEEAPSVSPTVLIGGHVVFASRGGLVLTKVKAGQEVQKGETLGEIVDLSGDVVEKLNAPSHAILTNVGTLGLANPGDMLYVLGNLTK